MKIRIFGTVPPCMKCKAAEKTVREAVKELGYKDIEVTKEDALSEEAGKLGIMMTPTVMIDKKVITVGRVPTKEEVKRAIEEIREGG
ncbi:MAG: thioredoxin family protein [Candidatus Hadarchaeum sp.]|uniref:thioredoxin family protein n=1 Tax=Candidatus Hadarchaeum sp. TaxID=2883567 RepID=UPI003D0DD77F